MRGASKSVLTGPNCIDYSAVTPLEDCLPKRPSSWLHQEFGTLMHDLIHTLFLVGVAF